MAANADVLCIRTLLERSCKYTWKTRLMAASVDESHANTRMRSSPVPNNVLTPNVGSRATATAVKASNDATRCAATRREVNVHTSSTSSMTSTGVQVQATMVEATAGAHTTSAVADTQGRAEAPGSKKVKRRRRQRKNDTTPSHVVMVITDETVEERKQRLSDEADRKNESQTTKKRKTKMSSESNNFSGKCRRSAMPRLLTDWRD